MTSKLRGEGGVVELQREVRGAYVKTLKRVEGVKKFIKIADVTNRSPLTQSPREGGELDFRQGRSRKNEERFGLRRPRIEAGIWAGSR